MADEVRGDGVEGVEGGIVAAGEILPEALGDLVMGAGGEKSIGNEGTEVGEAVAAVEGLGGKRAEVETGGDTGNELDGGTSGIEWGGGSLEEREVTGPVLPIERGVQGRPGGGAVHRPVGGRNDMGRGPDNRDSPRNGWIGRTETRRRSL